MQINCRRKAFEAWQESFQWYFKRAVGRIAGSDLSTDLHITFNEGSDEIHDSYSIFFGQQLLHTGGAKAGKLERGAGIDFGWTPSGDIIPLLIPASTSGSKRRESRIRLWSFPAEVFNDLSLDRLNGYARALVAYQRVTSLSIRSNPMDHLIVLALSISHPVLFDDKWTWHIWRHKKIAGAIFILAALATIWSAFS